jgi:hypothetical protein
MEDGSQGLAPYERHMACILASLLLGLGLYVVYTDRYEEQEVRPIVIHVVGAVRDELLSLPYGSTIDDVIRCATLDEKADAEALTGSKVVNDREIVVIPFRNRTTVYVTGAIAAPTVVVLNTADTIKDILPYVHLQEDADVSSFLRRKRVMNGSVIEIKHKRPRIGKMRDCNSPPQRPVVSEKSAGGGESAKR